MKPFTLKITLCIVNKPTEIHYWSVVSRNYGGKTSEIAIIVFVYTSPQDSHHRYRHSKDYKSDKRVYEDSVGSKRHCNEDREFQTI